MSEISTKDLLKIHADNVRMMLRCEPGDTWTAVEQAGYLKVGMRLPLKFGKTTLGTVEVTSVSPYLEGYETVTFKVIGAVAG